MGIDNVSEEELGKELADLIHYAFDPAWRTDPLPPGQDPRNVPGHGYQSAEHVQQIRLVRACAQDGCASGCSV